MLARIGIVNVTALQTPRNAVVFQRSLGESDYWRTKFAENQTRETRENDGKANEFRFRTKMTDVRRSTALRVRCTSVTVVRIR